MPELKFKVKNSKDYSLHESLQRLMTQAFTVGIDDAKNEVTLFHVDEIPFEKKNLVYNVLQPFFEDDLSKCAASTVVEEKAVTSDPVEDARLAEVVEDKIEELDDEDEDEDDE